MSYSDLTSSKSTRIVVPVIATRVPRPSELVDLWKQFDISNVHDIKNGIGSFCSGMQHEIFISILHVQMQGQIIVLIITKYLANYYFLEIKGGKSLKKYCYFFLTHCAPVISYGIKYPAQHCLRWWLVACLVPSHHMNQC